ncbi:OsmC family protein [Acetobacter conturbans]|uniref:OsmC family peroxiredoxin n=1 Tax=Acetobacter conturbans TaxID=1737472 RepID=A0ABX0JYG9_9PROT|nr:OsmC family protein [Acetobacter conturbans]NHN87093.1 OsmC family peroxiredoxin [Acetobacter conturbans]
MASVMVVHEGGLRCRAEHEPTGTVVIANAPQELGGAGETFSPTDLLSASLGGCILSIMELSARSMDTAIPGARVIVDKEMGGTPGRIIRIDVTVQVPGVFDERQKRKPTAAADACPVHKALAVDAPITIEWLGNEAGPVPA